MQKAKNFNIILPTVFIRGYSLTLLTSLFMLSFSAIVHAQPKLEIVGGTAFTLGVIPEDTIVHKTLIVKNIGTDTLTVQGVRTSCGCTIAKPSSDRVAPNDSMQIPVSFNTHNFDGPVKKEVYFETNDSTNLHMDIVLLANIKAMIELRPHYISFYEMKLHSPDVRLDTIRNNTDVAIRIESVSVHDPQITAILRDSVLNGRQFTLLQTTINPIHYGNIFGQIDLKTNYPRKPLISLSYVAHVRK